MTTVVHIKQSDISEQTGLPTRLWVGVPVALDQSGRVVGLDSNLYLPVTGGERFSTLSIAPSHTTLVFDKITVTKESAIHGGQDGTPHWSLVLGDETSDSSFVLRRYSGSAFVGTALRISRFTGHLSLEGDPVAPSHAATKRYVDMAVYGREAISAEGGTMLGYLVLAKEAPVLRAHAANKGYVDDGDGRVIQRVNTKLSRDGDIMRGLLTLWGEPIIDMHAVPKKYVDEIVKPLVERIKALEAKLGL